MNQSLKLIGIPPTLNEIRRMHYHEQARVKLQWEQMVGIEVRMQKLKPMDKPAIVTYRFHFKDNRVRDPDGYAYSAKAIQDGLVKNGILPDDSFRYVKELRITEGERRKAAGITVEIIPWEASA